VWGKFLDHLGEKAKGQGQAKQIVLKTVLNMKFFLELGGDMEKVSMNLLLNHGLEGRGKVTVIRRGETNSLPGHVFTEVVSME